MSEKTDGSCISCRTNKVSTECELCFESLCKKCVLSLEEGAFAFLPEVPENLKKLAYCPFCFDLEVAPEQEKYQEVLNRAKEVTILTDSYKGFIPLLKKSKTDVEVAGCPDRDEAIMRLAFSAATEGYNAVLKTSVVSLKIRNYGYQKSEWRGSGRPAVIDEDKLKLNELREEVWRRGH